MLRSVFFVGLFKVNLSISAPSSLLKQSVIELEKLTEFHPHQPGYYQVVEVNSAFIQSRIAIGKHRTIYITANCGNISIISRMKLVYLFSSLVLVKNIK